MASDPRIMLVGTGFDRPEADRDHPAVAGADVVIGSRAALASLEGIAARTIPARAPVEDVLEQAAAALDEGKTVTVLTSGDPLFFSLGVSFLERFGPEKCRAYPGISSLQRAASRLGIPWGNVACVSAHGRKGFLPLAHAALQGGPVFLLTDAINTPGNAARFLLKRGRTGYSAAVAANLGADGETVWRGQLAEAAGQTFPTPNVAFFLPEPSRDESLPLCLGHPESAFAHEGALITKWPVRAAALAALRIEPRHVIWDLGSGSGAVAVEAASLARRGHVIAVEREAGRVRHIEENRRRFGAANLDILHAAMPRCLEESHAVTGGSALCGDALPRPDRVFIGGGLGGGGEEAARLIRLAWERLLPGGRLVASCVLLHDFLLARQTLAALDSRAEVTLVQASHAEPLGNDAHLRAQNPVFCIAAQKER